MSLSDKCDKPAVGWVAVGCFFFFFNLSELLAFVGMFLEPISSLADNERNILGTISVICLKSTLLRYIWEMYFLNSSQVS